MMELSIGANGLAKEDAVSPFVRASRGAVLIELSSLNHRHCDTVTILRVKHCIQVPQS